MKLKDDFITNSSSTAFFFIFSGKKKEKLFNLIRKYKKIFNQSVDYGFGNVEDTRSCDSGYVIDSIDSVITEDDKYDEYSQCKIEPIKKLIKDYEEQVVYWENEVKKELERPEKRDPDASIRYEDYAESYRVTIRELKEAKGKGLSSFLRIEFGDNHGQICGGNAVAMDYNRDNLIIKEKDFYLLNECQH